VTGQYPAQWIWSAASTLQPAAATSGTPKVEQYRNGRLIATYATLGGYDPNGTCTRTENASQNPEATVGCGPFNRGEPFRQWQSGDTFLVYPAVYAGPQHQPWIGPQYDTAAQYNANAPFVPTNITIEGVTVNGVRPVIVVGSGGISNSTLGQAPVYFDSDANVTFENIDIDAGGAPNGSIGKAAVYINGGTNLTIADSRIHGFESAGVNGLFGTGNNAGTLELDRLELYQNGGPNGPAHNAYIGASTIDPNFTVHLLNSYSHDAFYGHLFKTRAQVNVIEGDYFAGGLPQGGAYTQAENYLLDVPNGGRLTARDDIFTKNMSGANSNGVALTYATEGVPDGRALSIAIENDTFVAFAKTFDGSHGLEPYLFYYPGQEPGTSGFPVSAVSVTRNEYVGYCPTGDPVSDYRGSLALTADFSDLNLDFTPKATTYVSTDQSIVGAPEYAHVAQGGYVRATAALGARD
jgi:hypothetical protein